MAERRYPDMFNRNWDSDDEDVSLNDLIRRYRPNHITPNQLVHAQPERAAHDQRVIQRIQNDSSDDEMELPPRDYSHGDDWIYKIPQNRDGSRDTCIDLSFTGYWTLSSCKSAHGTEAADGFGINELLSNEVDRIWQSDGPQPHMITIEFNTKVDICFIMLYLDYKNDESYTPAKINVITGSSLTNLGPGREYEFNEPIGWQAVDLRNKMERPARTFILQMQVLQNHQNGRDTHIRHMRIVGPEVKRFCPVRRMRRGTAQQICNREDPFRNEPIRRLKSKFVQSCIIR